MGPAMSDTDNHSRFEQATKYYLIFLHSIPERPLSREVVDLHAAHLAELDDGGKLVMAGPLLERAGGLIVLRTASAAEAMAIAEEDPLVRGRHRQTGPLGQLGEAHPAVAGQQRHDLAVDLFHEVTLAPHGCRLRLHHNITKRSQPLR